MIAYITEVTEENYENFIDNDLSLLDLYANWCKPCKTLKPVIDKISNEYYQRVKVGALDVSENIDIPASLGIRNIPTLIIFQKGTIIKKLTGVVSEDEIKNELDKLL